jgi:capsid protein
MANKKYKQLKKQFDALKSQNKAFSQYLSPGYEAADTTSQRRRSPPTTTSSEDWHANHRRRQILTANGRDLSRNFDLAASAINKHLSFVTDLTFQATTADRGFNKELEAWWCEQCKPWNFDVAGRHDWRRGIRLAEACRVIDGDIGWLKIGNGANRGTIQAIEGDRIMMPFESIPDNHDPETWVNGVRIDTKSGKALAYAICDRAGPTQKEFNRTVRAGDLILHAHYGFRYDQVRGVSPLANALNTWRDALEISEYALAKIKISQLFGLQIKTTSSDAGPFFGQGTTTYTKDADGDGTPDSAPRVQMFKGPFVTELDPDESMDIVESKTPSTEMVKFLQLTIQRALQALGIPYCLFDESFGTYAGQRSAIMQYLNTTCVDHIANVTYLACQHANWKMGIGVADGTLILPSGKDYDFIKDAYEFVPGAYPTDQPQRESRSNAQNIAMGTDNPYRVAQAGGTNFESNIDKIADALEYANSKGVKLTYTDSTLFAPEITGGAPPTDESNQQPT